MFSNCLKYYFNRLADDKNLIPSTAVESIIKYDMGYPFSRQFVNDLQKKQKTKDGNTVDFVITTGVEIGRRIKYTYESVVEVLEYLLVCDSVTGMIRGNVKGNRKEIIAISKLVAQTKNVSIKQIAYTGDVRQGNVSYAGPLAPEEYDPAMHRKRVLDFQTRCSMAFFFFHNWLGDVKSPDFDFYRDWHVIKSRVVSEDSFANEAGVWEDSLRCKEDIWGYISDVKMEEVDDCEYESNIPFFNRYVANRKWDYAKYGSIKPVGDLTRNGTGTSLRDSILVLDAFLRTATYEDRLKVSDWMEIILMYENGSHWVVDEAKAALKQDVPSLDQESLIDDWWMLSLIYLGLNGEITHKSY